MVMKKTVKRLICLASAFALMAGSAFAAVPQDFYDSGNESVPGTVLSTPDENIFTVDESDDEWIFLDATEDGIFVLKNESAGDNIAFDSASSVRNPIIEFDIDSSTNIAAIINSQDFIDKYIPEAIAENMLETEWEIAAGTADGLIPEPYSVTSRVTLLSAEEYAQYFEKIGADCGGAWFLRDPHPTQNNAWVEVANASTGSRAAGKLYSVQSFNFNRRAVRPACMLDSDFFRNVKLDVDNMGENIIEYIKANYEKEDLSDIYDSDDLNTIFDGVRRPEVENLVLTGENRTGYPIGYDYDFVHPEGKGEGESIVKWYLSSGASSADYTEITVTDGEYYILPADAGKYLTVEVTPVDEDGTPGRAVRSEPMGPLAASAGILPNQSALFENQQPAADPDYIFNVDGWSNGFVLLDEDENGRFFIGTTDEYGTVAFDSNGGVKFDPEDPANVGYYLNTTVLNGENSGTRLPGSVIEYIDRDTVWFTEAGNANSNAPHDYYTQAAISLLSYTEWQEYYQKFGFDNGYTIVGWWLRSPMGNGDVTADILAVRTNSSVDFQGRAFQYGSSAALLVRPVFWVEGDFFKNVKLDVSTMGSEVKNMMLRNYTMDDLSSGSAGYTQEELEAMGFADAPLADGLYISGIAASGNQIQAAYDYTAEAAEGESDFQWYISDSADGALSPIDGASQRYLDVSDDMVGKYVSFSVIPKNADGVGGMRVECGYRTLIAQSQSINLPENEVMNEQGGYPSVSDSVITYSATVEGEPAELTLIIAYYGENNELISVDTRDYSLQGQELSINESIAGDAAADSIRIILLEKDTNRPLMFKEIR